MLKMLYITMILFLHCQLLKLLNLKVIFFLLNNNNLIRLHANGVSNSFLSLFEQQIENSTEYKIFRSVDFMIQIQIIHVSEF